MEYVVVTLVIVAGAFLIYRKVVAKKLAKTPSKGYGGGGGDKGPPKPQE